VFGLENARGSRASDRGLGRFFQQGLVDLIVELGFRPAMTRKKRYKT
jgi:hypothetical protein